LLPLYPLAFQRLRLRGYDLVLSSSSSFAKGIDVGAAHHVCYCHTPPRFLWQTDRYVEQMREPWKRMATRAVTGALRAQDRRDADNVDLFIANSRVTQERIRSMYQRDAAVIYPPINVAEFHVADTIEPYFLVVSRLLPYKRVDIVVQACNRLKLPLMIIGDGPDRVRLQRMAGPTVTLCGRLPRRDVLQHLARCQALIMPGAEDFGLTSLEANASGRAVIAYRAGGALETVIEGRTGWFFAEQSAAALAPVLRRVAAEIPLDTQVLRAHALRFDVTAFRSAITHMLRRVCSIDGQILPRRTIRTGRKIALRGAAKGA
jgi:glycosyltransferase involved in cell wall biosynthesis